jgi:hypothetical protein
MKPKDNVRTYLYLLATWIVLLVLQRLAHLYLAPGNLLIYAVDSLAPIPVIVLVVVFLIGLLLETRDQRDRKQQLMYIKSYLFRLELRDLYIADFLALKSPAVTFAEIKNASLPELKKMREQANTVDYDSPEAMESVIKEYEKARGVWREFLNIARENGFNDIFQDMLFILHFISDVSTFRELNPSQLFMYKAANDESLMQTVLQVLGDGIRKYLDYVIELKEKQPQLFNQVVADHELLAATRLGRHFEGAAAPAGTACPQPTPAEVAVEPAARA